MTILEKDVYVAYKGDNGVCFAMDEYSISHTSSGFLVESNNTVFGANGFQQKSVLKTNSEWLMQELHVVIESMKIEVCASVNDGRLFIKQNQSGVNFEKNIDLQGDKFFYV